MAAVRRRPRASGARRLSALPRGRCRVRNSSRSTWAASSPTTRRSTRSSPSTSSRRSAARDADAQRASGADLGPLHGLPITLKDSYETALRTVCGRTDLEDHVPGQDAEAVRRLRSAGAVIIGKTNMPAGNQDVQAGNPMFGPTLNPWNTARTSGGSAGGGAVAAAAGLTALDFGSPAKSASRAAHHCENTCMPPSASHRSPTGAPSAAPCPRHTEHDRAAPAPPRPR